MLTNASVRRGCDLPITTSIEPTTGARLHEVTGHLNLEELGGTLTKIYESADFDPDQDVLWNLLKANLSAFSVDDIRQVTHLVKDNWGASDKSRAALVVARDLDFGLARMYQQLLEGQSLGEVRIFRNVDEAIEWLSAK
jgi:hypothetical protein